MSDPRSQQKQAEIMELYKKHGVNPMGGCLPMVIQLPFLIAFYKVLVGLRRNAARAVAVGCRSHAAGTLRHPFPAADHDRDQRSAAEDDAHTRGRRSQPAENDAVHARDDGYLLLVAVKRRGVILPDQ